MKNIFYFYNINVIGGIESFFYYLAKTYKDWDITIYYKQGDTTQLKRLKQYVRLVKYTGQKIECDKAFFNFNLDIIDNVEAKEYCCILHGDYKAMFEQGQLNGIPQHSKINKYYGVSQVVCDSYKELTGINVELVYNPIVLEKPRKILHLISATRLTREKGKNRIIKLANTLDDYDIPYLWTIFTNDTNIINNPNIIYMKPRLDISNYIADADYLVQLSDNEGYCYSVVESLCLGTPVIVTKLPVLLELGVNETNSIILDFDMKNIPIEKIYQSKDKFNFKYIPYKSNWDKVLIEGKTTYTEEKNQENLQYVKYLVEALDTYSKLGVKDSILNKIPSVGERFMVSENRLNMLLGNNTYEKPFVKIIKEVD